VNDTIFFYLSEEERNDIDQFEFSLTQPAEVQPLHQELFQLYQKANNNIQLILESQVNGIV
jgi:hypothetical protein